MEDDKALEEMISMRTLLPILYNTKIDSQKNYSRGIFPKTTICILTIILDKADKYNHIYLAIVF
jgi:hypothetical protein